MYYEEAFRYLDAQKVRYLVVGGLAVNLHGVPRATMDLDLMIDTARKNIETFISVLKEIGFKPRIQENPLSLTDTGKRAEWRAKKHMITFSFYNPEVPYQQVDVFIENPIDFNEAYNRKEIVSVGDVRIPILSLNDLVRIKQLSNRLQDVSDVEALKQVRRIQKENENDRR
jgi:hypothetical protein